MSDIPNINTQILADITGKVTDDLIKQTSSGEIASLEALRDAAYKKYIQYFKDLTVNGFDPELYSRLKYRDVNIYNSNINKISRNIEILYNEMRSIQTLVAGQDTLFSMFTDQTIDKLAGLTSSLDTIENQIERVQFYNKGKAVLILEDNFDDASKLDFTKMPNPGNIIKGFGIELPVSSDINRTSLIKDVDIINISTKRAADLRPASDDKLAIRPLPYEGKRLGNPKEARPEGGNWRIESINTSISTNSPTLSKDRIYTNLKEAVWDPETSIIGTGTPTTEEVTTNVVTYNILKDAVSLETGATSITPKGATGSEISGWVTSQGLTRTVADTDASVYTYVRVVTPTTETINTGTTNGEKNPALANYRIATDEELFDDRLPDNVGFISTDLNNVSLSESDPFAKTLDRDDFQYVETKASAEQLLTSRFKMFDENPVTFWEIEYTPLAESIESTIYGEADAQSTVGAKSGAYSSAQNIAKQAVDGLNSSEIDWLQATLHVTFEKDCSMNYILLNPILFGDIRAANFKVTNIEFKSSISNWKKLPGFEEDFSNVISVDSSQVLSDKHLSRIGANNKFAYRGQGVWTLPPSTLIQEIKITLRQDLAIPNPFPLKNIQLLRKVSKSISESISSSSSSVGGFKTNSTSNSATAQELEKGRLTQWLEFGYLETVISELTGGSNTSLLAGTTSGDNTSTTGSNGTSNENSRSTGGIFGIFGNMIGSNVALTKGSTDQAVSVTSAIAGGLIAAGGALLDRTLSGGGGSSSNSSTNVGFTDTGYQINKEWFRTVWSRVRYAIGIREIGFFAKTFKTQADVVSIPYQIYNGDKEITVEVTRVIPTEFLNLDPSKSYIEYYVSVDGTPYRIQPIVGEAKQFENGRAIPSSYNLQNLSKNELVEIRFVAKLFRPSEGQLSNADSMTVILENYKVIISDR